MQHVCQLLTLALRHASILVITGRLAESDKLEMNAVSHQTRHLVTIHPIHANIFLLNSTN